MGNMSSNASFAKTLITALIPELDKRIKSKTLKCIEELKGSSTFAVMTAVEKRDQEMVKKLQFILPDFK